MRESPGAAVVAVTSPDESTRLVSERLRFECCFTVSEGVGKTTKLAVYCASFVFPMCGCIYINYYRNGLAQSLLFFL